MEKDARTIFRTIHGGLWNEIDSLGLDPDTRRECLKAVLSVLLAVLLASLLDLPDIVWAAVSGFLVMKSTLAEALPRAAYRITGTLVGALLGGFLALWVAGDPVLLMAALFAVSWVAIFQGSVSPHSYAWVLFGATSVMVMTSALSAPADTARFAAVRAAEVSIGSVAALLVAGVFEAFGAPPGLGAPQAAAVAGARLSFRHLWNEDWLARNWALVIHATQAAIAVAALPLLWRFLGISDFVTTAVTSFVVMIVPMQAIAADDTGAVYERVIHRILGCLIGGVSALLCLRFAADDQLLWTLCLSLGVWIGFHIQSGRTGLSYLGLQAAFAFLIAFVQGPGPVTSLDPPLERLLGVLIGSVMIGLVILAWPSRSGARAVASQTVEAKQRG
jgi:uncharacterized membrane protein YccC